MVFWLAVLAGALFAWIAVQIGFYAAWTMLFHLVLSAYVAIFLTPVVVAQVPAATAMPYGYALTLVSVAAATLLIAYGTCFACLSGRMYLAFPDVFDKPAAGLVGFLAGFLVASFVSFSLALTPLSQTEFLKTLGCDAQSQRTNTAYVCWWCDRLHALVSSPDAPPSSQQAVDKLLKAVAAPAADREKEEGGRKRGEG